MDVFAVLSDPTRRRIIETLLDGEQSFGQIADRFEISRPAVSQHLKALREAKVVNVRRDAQCRIYSLERNGLAEVDDWLGQVRQFWTNRLDKLERALRQQSEQGNDYE